MAEKEPLSKSTPIPRVTIGLALALISVVVWVVEYRVNLNNTIEEPEQRISRQERRFDGYSGRNGANTEDIVSICSAFNRIHQEDPCM